MIKVKIRYPNSKRPRNVLNHEEPVLTFADVVMPVIPGKGECVFIDGQNFEVWLRTYHFDKNNKFEYVEVFAGGLNTKVVTVLCKNFNRPNDAPLDHHEPVFYHLLLDHIPPAGSVIHVNSDDDNSPMFVTETPTYGFTGDYSRPSSIEVMTRVLPNKTE